MRDFSFVRPLPKLTFQLLPSPVDAQKSEFQISTSQVGEAPELETLGTLSTGFHGSVPPSLRPRSH